jgi:protein-tyrosine phosphatase
MEFITTELSTELACKYNIKLEPFSNITSRNYAGPLPESNKVFESFYAGAFPGDIDDYQNDNNLITLLNAGFDAFVCLMTEYNDEAPEEDWRNTYDHLLVRPYLKDINRIIDQRDQYPTLQDSVKNDITFKHYPIMDMNTISDLETMRAAHEIVALLQSGKKVYLHCWGGHGRTGILVCLVLHLVCGLSAEQAFSYCQHVHDLRENNCLETPSPQNFQQRQQVKRIIESISAY